MAKNGKKYFWISLAGFILTALIVLVPYLFGAGKAQANLVSADTAMGIRVDGVEEDVEKLETKFDAYHKAQTEANTEILSRLPE